MIENVTVLSTEGGMGDARISESSRNNREVSLDLNGITGTMSFMGTKTLNYP